MLLLIKFNDFFNHKSSEISADFFRRIQKPPHFSTFDQTTFDNLIRNLLLLKTFVIVVVNFRETILDL